jgi:hypothetical protein
VPWSRPAARILGAMAEPEAKIPLTAQAIVIAGAIRNELEMFHAGDGFITNPQMKMLNIVIRHTVHEALVKLAAAQRGDDRAMVYCSFNMAMFNPDYMEYPGSAELDDAVKQIKTGLEGGAG